MPIDFSLIALSEAAFTPAIAPTIDLKARTAFYEEAPEDAEDNLRGTIKDTDSFSEQEKEILERFNKQFKHVIVKIKIWCSAHEISKELLMDFEKFSNQMQSRKFYSLQSPSFYTLIKKWLEIIAINLSDNLQLNDTIKARIMTDLLTEVRMCGPGLFNHIENAKNSLSSNQTIAAWLAMYRKTIVKSIASQHSIAKNILVGNRTHVENVFLKYAADQGWNAYGFESLTAVNEIHTGLAGVTAEDFELCKKKFFEEYTPTSIMRELATLFNHHIFERIKKRYAENNNGRNCIKLSNLQELRDLLAGLPLADQDNTQQIFFNSEEIEEEKSDELETKTSETPTTLPLYIEFGDQYLHQTSISDSMIRMTQFFIDINMQLFKFFKDEKNYFTFVFASPALSYTFFPIDEHSNSLELLSENTVLEIDMLAFQRLRIPLKNSQFYYYYKKGFRNFSGYILDGVDFTREDFNFDDSQLKIQTTQLCHIKTTPKQFIHLFSNHYLSKDFIPYTLMSQEEVPPYIKDILDKTSHQKGILLFFAVINNLPNLIRSLLAENADWHDLKINSENAILFAISLERWECVKEFAVIPDQDNKFRFGSALLRAARSNQCNVVKVLIQAKAQLDWSNNSDLMTPLHWAAYHGNPEMVTALLAGGSDASLKNKQGHTPIETASLAKHWACVKAFAVIPDQDNKFRFGSALLEAAISNQCDIVEELIQAKAFLNWSYSSNKMTPLHWAAFHENQEMVSALLRGGADASRISIAGFTPIQIAANNQNWECVNAFAVASDQNNKCRFGSALLTAAVYHQWETVRRLILAKAHLNWRNVPSNTTALHLAAKSGKLEIVRALLKAGAAASLITTNGLTPIQLAANNQHWECVTEFATVSDRDNKFRFGYALLEAAAHSQWDIVEKLHQCEARVDQENLTKITAASERAVAEKNTKTIQILLYNTPEILLEEIKKVELSENKHQILKALSSYCSNVDNSFSSEPLSQRRQNDITQLLTFLIQDKEEETIANIRKYVTHSIQTGFFGRSALRSKVLNVLNAINGDHTPRTCCFN